MKALPFGSETEWSLSEKIAVITDGGFDGLEVPWTPLHPFAEAIELAQTTGMPFGITCFPTSSGHFAELLAAFRELDPGPRYLNLQPVPKVFSVTEGAALLREWIRMAADAGFVAAVETHRDRMTTDLRFTLQLLDAVPEMRLTADLSHYLLGQEFAWPIDEENHALIRRILDRADLYHGRVASREQVQIAIGWAHHQQWLELFLGWWEDGFRRWRASASEQDDLIFVTELGPPGWYAITGPDGKELSDRWAEALQLKESVTAIWERLDNEGVSG